MDDVILDQLPSLTDGLLVAAFAGWNDAGEAATSALQWLLHRRDNRRFAQLDPDEYYDFTAARPVISIDASGLRQLEWPANEWHVIDGTDGQAPLVVFIGVEPQLHWRRFSRTFVDLAQRVGVSKVVLLGAYIQDVPHTRPPRLTGASNDPEWQQRLLSAGVTRSHYQGPTGIVSVVQQAAAELQLPSASIWGVVPHYISAHPNPRVMHALLRALTQTIDIRLDLMSLDREAQTFEQRVDDALRNNPEALEMVRSLEREADGATETAAAEGESLLPDTENLLEELERFLRSRRQDENQGDKPS